MTRFDYQFISWTALEYALSGCALVTRVKAAFIRRTRRRRARTALRTGRLVSFKRSSRVSPARPPPMPAGVGESDVGALPVAVLIHGDKVRARPSSRYLARTVWSGPWGYILFTA